MDNGDTVTVQQTSSVSYSTTTNTTLTIGGISDTFSGISDTFSVTTRTASSLGDIDHDGNVNLSDVILALQIIAGLNPGNAYLDADVNGDGKIGLAELIYILQKVSGLRE